MRSYSQATFRSLGHRAYRLYFIGQIVSTVGTWAQKVAQAWLILELTGSGTLLGVTAGLQQAPTLLLTAWAGLVADRVDRRTILLWTQCAGAAPALVLGILAATGRISVPAVMALALLLGVVEAFDKPARHTFAADIVPPEDVPNAVSLNATMFNAGKVLGPAAAGIAISLTGVATTFTFNALSYLVMAVTLLCIRPQEIRPRKVAPRARGDLRAGFTYARRAPVIFAVLSLTTMSGLVAYEWNTLVPLLARAYSSDASTIGFFFAVMGAGAILGSLSLAGSLVATPRALLIAAVVFTGVLGLVAAAPTLGLALLALFALGASATTFRALATALVQLESDARMRGRTVSLLIMALSGTSPISGPLVGAMAEHAGARAAVAVGAAATALAVLGTWLYLRTVAPERLTRWEGPRSPSRCSPLHHPHTHGPLRPSARGNETPPSRECQLTLGEDEWK